MTPRADAPAGAGRGYSALQLQPFDLSGDTLSGILELDLPSDAEGRVVAVRASSRARHKDWAAYAAVAIASNWAAEGARVLLVDLCFGEPHLHRAFGATNLEGITDAVEFGASLRRVVRPVNDGKFWMATAGTPVANTRSLLSRPRWHHFRNTLVEGGVTVVSYQAAESPFHPRGTPSIVLACEGEPMSALGSVGLRDAIALLGPAPSGTSVTMMTRKRENRLGRQTHRASLWEGFDDGTGAEEPSVTGAQPTPEAAASTRSEARKGAASVAGARAPGWGLSVFAFAVLVFFATLMILLAIDNAGIAEVPGADRFRELSEDLLARITSLFAQ